MNIGCRSIAALGLVCAFFLSSAVRAGAQIDPSATEIRFDIPAQPLAAALEAYATATGTVAIYNGNLASGRTSFAINGVFKARNALPALLKGTGLEAEFTTSKAFVVVPAEQRPVRLAPRAIAAAALTRQGAAEWRYAALVQQGITDALCSRAVTEPGSYRAAMRVWIGPTGALARIQLLGTTGDQSRDEAIAEFAGRVSIGEAPPAGMVQPVTMVLLPRSSGGEVSCSQLPGSLQHG